jgi:hypothetical protein
VGLLPEPNNDSLPKLMHLVVLHELNRMRFVQQLSIENIVAEKRVLLEKNGRPRMGRFDFFVRTKNTTIGIEVLSRPTKGKMKEKLAYAKKVDKFIFVLPANSLQLYKKSKKRFHEQARLLSFPPEFNSGKLYAWLLALPEGTLTEKKRFNRLFNVE